MNGNRGAERALDQLRFEPIVEAAPVSTDRGNGSVFPQNLKGRFQQHIPMWELFDIETCNESCTGLRRLSRRLEEIVTRTRQDTRLRQALSKANLREDAERAQVVDRGRALVAVVALQTVVEGGLSTGEWRIGTRIYGKGSRLDSVQSSEIPLDSHSQRVDRAVDRFYEGLETRLRHTLSKLNATFKRSLDPEARPRSRRPASSWHQAPRPQVAQAQAAQAAQAQAAAAAEVCARRKCSRARAPFSSGVQEIQGEKETNAGSACAWAARLSGGGCASRSSARSYQSSSESPLAWPERE